MRLSVTAIGERWSDARAGRDACTLLAWSKLARACRIQQAILILDLSENGGKTPAALSKPMYLFVREPVR